MMHLLLKGNLNHFWRLGGNIPEKKYDNTIAADLLTVFWRQVIDSHDIHLVR